MTKINILNMQPKGRYVNGKSFYDFHVPFSSGRLTTLNESFSTPEDAYNSGKEYIIKYESNHFPGGMGCVLGVTEDIKDNVIKYKAVVNTYYSNC